MPKILFNKETAAAAGHKSKRRAFEERFQEFLEEIDPATGRPRSEELREALMKFAKKGNVKAAELLMDRAWGKSKQTLDLGIETKGPGPISEAIAALKAKKKT